MDMGLVTEEDLEYSRFTWYKSDPDGERMLLGCCY